MGFSGTWWTSVNATYFVPTMREPFVMSGDCTVEHISIDPSSLIPPSLPFCSIPPFTSPTMVPREPEIISPDLDTPDLCHCITFCQAKTTFNFVEDLSHAGFDIRISRVTQDCCDQQFSVNALVNIPCLPLSVNTDVTIHIGTAGVPPTAVFSGHMTAPASGDCMLDLFLDIKIPPFSFGVSGLIMTVGSIDVSYGIGDLSLDFTRPLINEFMLKAHIVFPSPVGGINLTKTEGIGGSCIIDHIRPTFPSLGPAGTINWSVYNPIHNLTCGYYGTLYGMYERIHVHHDWPRQGHNSLFYSHCSAWTAPNRKALMSPTQMYDCFPCLDLSESLKITRNFNAAVPTIYLHKTGPGLCTHELVIDLKNYGCQLDNLFVARNFGAAANTFYINHGSPSCKATIHLDIKFPTIPHIPGAYTVCSWAGACGFISCGDLVGGRYISVYEDNFGYCHIEHECDALYSGKQIIDRDQGLGRSKSGNIVKFSWNAKTWSGNFDCGHLLKTPTSNKIPMSGCITLPTIRATGDWLTVHKGASMTYVVEHICTGPFAGSYIGKWEGNWVHDIQLITGGVIVFRNEIAFHVKCNHLVGITTPFVTAETLMFPT
jgi:hypothetical protein